MSLKLEIYVKAEYDVLKGQLNTAEQGKLEAPTPGTEMSFRMDISRLEGSIETLERIADYLQIELNDKEGLSNHD